MKTKVIITLAVLGTAMAAPQSRRPTQRQSFAQQQPKEDQQPQFTSRFNPNDNNQNNNQQDFYQPQQQQQQPQKQANNFAADTRRETTTFIPIIRFDNQQTVDGGYKTIWETGNNILAEETGVLKSFGDGQNNADAVVQQGSYSYTSPEGQLINVQYTADERGFRATGDHLPTPPPIPADIQKSLDVIYAGIAQQQRQGGNNQQQEGQYNEDQYNPQNDKPQQQQGNINFRPTGNRNSNRGFRQ